MPKTALGPRTTRGPAPAAVLAALMLLAGGSVACSDEPRDQNYGNDAGAGYDVVPLPTVDVANDTKVSDAAADAIEGGTGTDTGVLPETPMEAPDAMEIDMADAATGE
jgi:hypothetical protein